MRTVRVDPLDPDPALMEEAGAILRRGGLVAFPTETVYGLGGNALDGQAVARIFAAPGVAWLALQNSWLLRAIAFVLFVKMDIIAVLERLGRYASVSAMGTPVWVTVVATGS